MGLDATMFLRRKTALRKPPVALISFDDTVQAFVENLSSYTFNMPALVEAMLEHVLAARMRTTAMPPACYNSASPAILYNRRSRHTANSQHPAKDE